MFIAYDIAVFMAVMNDIMASCLHHLAKFYYLLCVRTGHVFFIADRVRHAKDVKSHCVTNYGVVGSTYLYIVLIEI